MQADVKDIILPTQDTDLPTVPDHITEEAQLWSLLAIDPTTVDPVTGMDACITSGSQAIGQCGMVGKSGFVAITWREDTEPRAGWLGNGRENRGPVSVGLRCCAP